MDRCQQFAMYRTVSLNAGALSALATARRGAPTPPTPAASEFDSETPPAASTGHGTSVRSVTPARMHSVFDLRFRSLA
jgi:hypothetical protein